MFKRKVLKCCGTDLWKTFKTFSTHFCLNIHHYTKYKLQNILEYKIKGYHLIKNDHRDGQRGQNAAIHPYSKNTSKFYFKSLYHTTIFI